MGRSLWGIGSRISQEPRGEGFQPWKSMLIPQPKTGSDGVKINVTVISYNYIVIIYVQGIYDIYLEYTFTKWTLWTFLDWQGLLQHASTWAESPLPATHGLHQLETCWLNDFETYMFAWIDFQKSKYTQGCCVWFRAGPRTTFAPFRFILCSLWQYQDDQGVERWM